MQKIILAAALTAIGVPLLAQRQSAPPSDANANPPAATTSPAGSGGLTTGRGRGPAVPQGPAPKLPDGRPDFSGVWQVAGPVGDLAQGMPKGASIPLNDAGTALMASRKSGDDPEANCLPTGVPRVAPYPMRMLQTPTHVFMLFEGNIHSYRQIFMNGKHPEDPDPTWYGHSVGHWEGNTLVVDTVGFNDKFWFDYKGHPHTEKLHTIEHYTRTDAGHMAIEVTIDDPGTYKQPFTTVGRATLMPGAELLEYICQENNQHLQRLEGPVRGPGLN